MCVCVCVCVEVDYGNRSDSIKKIEKQTDPKVINYYDVKSTSKLCSFNDNN